MVKRDFYRNLYLIHLFVQQIFVEYLLCVMKCSRYLCYITEQTDKNPCTYEADSLMRGFYKCVLQCCNN
jgi:hypothetical protein